jgi:uncharacterized protein YqeY
VNQERKEKIRFVQAAPKRERKDATNKKIIKFGNKILKKHSSGCAKFDNGKRQIPFEGW